MQPSTYDFDFDFPALLGDLSIAMGLPRKKKVSPDKSARALGTASEPVLSAPARGDWRKWLFRLAAAVLSPLILLAVLEGLLWSAGYGYPTSFFLSKIVGGQKIVVENQKFGWRFFGRELARKPYPLSFPELKPPGTIRIFVFGESAAYGDPQPDVGMPRVLAALLRNRYPDTRFEVINTAIVAVNSNVILPIARDCARKKGDIWVIYMGNNEVVGPFGTGTVFGWRAPALAVIRATLALKTTRTGQWLAELAGHLRAAPPKWRGMMMFLGNQVRQNDPGMEAVYAHFAQNLDDIVRAGRAAGAEIVVSTVAVNLKDSPPFGSLPRQDLTPQAAVEWKRHFDAGVTAEQGGNFAEAAACFAQAAQKDDEFADLQFRWARCCLALGRQEEARRHFTRALDGDTLRFRADSRINKIIRDQISGRENEGVLLADGQAAVAARSPWQLPGDDVFYEHVHLKFEGNYALARALAEPVARRLPETVTRGAQASSQWLTEKECARQLIWNDWGFYHALQSLRFESPPYSYQMDHAQKMRRFREQLTQLSSRLSPASLRQTLDDFREAAVRAPGDWVFWKNIGELQAELGDFNGAGDSFQRVIELLPHRADAYLQRALVLTRQGRIDDAEKDYQMASALDEDMTRATFVKQDTEAAAAAFQKGNMAVAILMSRKALQLEPYSTPNLLNLAEALLAAGKVDEAQAQLRTALQQPPGTLDEWMNLGQACLRQGWTNEASRSFEAALRIDGADAHAHLGLANTLAAAGQMPEAQQHYAQAAQCDPESAVARLDWGSALLKAGKSAEALHQFREVLRLDPNNTAARRNIDNIVKNQ